MRDTTDCSEPDPFSPLYTAPIPVFPGSEVTAKAVAYKEGMTDSVRVSGRYAVSPEPTAERGILFASKRTTTVTLFDPPQAVSVSELYRMSASGEKQIRLSIFTPFDDGLNFPMDFTFGGADWSPDGTQIAYRYAADLNYEDDDLRVRNADGTGGKRIAGNQWIYGLK